MKNILIVEDNVNLREELKEVLIEYGYMIFEAGNGEKALSIIKINHIDLCLLDIGLPDCYGTDLCQRIREFSLVPIIFLTGCDEDEQIINAFQLGADDYVTKPFKLDILMSRIIAQLRRCDWMNNEQSSEQCYRSGDLIINPSLKQITRNNTILFIRPMEYEIFQILFENYGRIVSRNVILESLWDNKNNYVENNTLNVNISRLRKQLGTYEGNEYIETSKRQGYFWSINITKI